MKKLLLLSMAYFLASVFSFAGFTNVINSETTITASAPGNWGEVVENLRDNNTGTKYSCFFNSNSGISIQYELASSVTLYKYTLTSSNDSPGRDGKAWTFSGSNNGTDWNVLDERTNEFFIERFYTNEYVLRGNNTAYKYYRLFVTEIIGSDQLSFSEWKLFTEDDSTIVPATLKLTGTAVAEFTDDIELGWKGSCYELYTSLKSGNYSFDGDNDLSGGTITVDNDDAVPYRIRVDYKTLPAAITIEEITKMYLWVPWSQKNVAELTYVGNSTFKVEDITCSTEDWSGTNWEDRHRVRIEFENEALETYGPTNGNKFFIVGNSQWGPSDYNYDVDAKYKNTGVPFNATVVFNPSGNYTYSLTDYIPPMPETLSIQGTAVVESEGTSLAMKRDGVIFELYTSLSNGDYSFVGDDNLSGTLDIDEEPTPYRIRVNYTTNPAIISFEKITKAFLWVPWSQKTVAELDYIGNSTFKGKNIICSTQDWSGTDWEDRHRVRIEFENELLETYGPKDGSNFVLVGNSQWPPSDYNYNVDAKYKNTGVPFNAKVNLGASGDYTYSIEDIIITKLNDISVKATIYPTMVFDNIHIMLPESGFEVEFVSISGQTVLRGSTNSEELTFSGINIAKGIYLVKVTQNEQIVSVQRIIKR
jgi:hypothetical protein